MFLIQFEQNRDQKLMKKILASCNKLSQENGALQEIFFVWQFGIHSKKAF